jgi:DNA-binding CsgD family transcriptional regulator
MLCRTCLPVRIKLYMKRIVLLAGFTVIFCSQLVLAQPAMDKTADIDLQVKNLMEWYFKSVMTTDSIHAITALQRTEQEYSKGDPLVYQFAWFFRRLYPALKKAPWTERIAAMQQIATAADENDFDVAKAVCWHNIGAHYYELNKPGPAFEYLIKAQNLFTEKGYNRYSFPRVYANGLAVSFYQLGEFREAIAFFKPATVMPAFWKSVVYTPNVLNTIGLCYQQLKLYDSAVLYFRQTHLEAARYKDSFNMGLANGNLGYTYFLQGNDSAALPLLQSDYAASLKAAEWGSAANAAMTLATLAIKKGQSAEAAGYLQFARKYVYESHNIRVYRIWYDNLYRISRIKGDYRSMALYGDSLILYKDSVEQQQQQKVLHQAELKIETEQHLHKVNELENYRQKQVLLRNLLLVILLLVGIIGSLWLNRQRLKRKKELELAALEQANARQQLAFAQQELLDYTNKLKEKNELLESFRAEINRIQEQEQQQQSDKALHLSQLLQASILTEDDWKTFRDLFEKVHTGFFARLRTELPDLTPGDTRLLALTKLNLSGKEIAGMLGISYEAVKKARQRLRKKIEMSPAMGLEDIVQHL